MENGRKVLALVAHDGKKAEIVAWAMSNVENLKNYVLVGTGHTAKLISDATGLKVRPYLSGPMGGDLEIGADVARGLIDGIVFFWDPLSMQPHDPDIKALLRIAVVYDVPICTNKVTADLLFRPAKN